METPQHKKYGTASPGSRRGVSPGGVRRASVSAPEVPRGTPVGRRREDAKMKYKGVIGVKFYDTYADRVAGLAPKKKVAHTAAAAGDGAAELRLRRAEIADLGFANDLLARRLEISESRCVEFQKAMDQHSARDHTRSLMSLQTEEQTSRETLKWSYSTAHNTLRTSWSLLLDHPSVYTSITSPPRAHATLLTTNETVIERLQQDLIKEKHVSGMLRENKAHEDAAKAAEIELKMSELDTENLKLSVVKRLDDVKIEQQMCHIKDLKEQLCKMEHRVTQLVSAKRKEPQEKEEPETNDAAPGEPRENQVLRSHTAPATGKAKAKRHVSISPNENDMKRDQSISPPVPGRSSGGSVSSKQKKQIMMQCIKKTPQATHKIGMSHQATSLRYSADNAADKRKKSTGK